MNVGDLSLQEELSTGTKCTSGNTRNRHFTLRLGRGDTWELS